MKINKLRCLENVFITFSGINHVIFRQVVPHISTFIVPKINQTIKIKRTLRLAKRHVVLQNREPPVFIFPPFSFSFLYLLQDQEQRKGMALPLRTASRSKTSVVTLNTMRPKTTCRSKQQKKRTFETKRVVGEERDFEKMGLFQTAVSGDIVKNLGFFHRSGRVAATVVTVVVVSVFLLHGYGWVRGREVVQQKKKKEKSINILREKDGIWGNWKKLRVIVEKGRRLGSL